MPRTKPHISATELRDQDAARNIERFNLVKGSKAIAEHVGLSQRDILNLIHAGDFPAFIVGNKMVADPVAMRKWLAAKSLAKMLSR